MEQKDPIPEDIKRFIIRSIESIPHLEAVLLLHYDPKIEWDAKMMSQRLYISEKRSMDVLNDLCAAGFAAISEVNHSYSYHPISRELSDLIARLVDIYSKNLIEVTNLIHFKTNKQAQQFGDAFKWQNEKE